MTDTRRAILDTNLFVGAQFKRTSASAAIVTAVREGRLVMVWATETRAETQRILDRIPPLDFAAVADLYSEDGRHAGPLDLEGVAFVEDAGDRKFAALSRATGAVIVTSDDDLLRHADRLDVARPAAFARILGIDQGGMRETDETTPDGP